MLGVRHQMETEAEQLLRNVGQELVSLYVGPGQIVCRADT